MVNKALKIFLVKLKKEIILKWILAKNKTKIIKIKKKIKKFRVNINQWI